MAEEEKKEEPQWSISHFKSETFINVANGNPYPVIRFVHSPNSQPNEKPKLLRHTIQGYTCVAFDNKDSVYRCIKSSCIALHRSGYSRENVRVHEDFTSEIQLIRNMNEMGDGCHPAIIAIISQWQSRYQMYAAMEYCNGGDLFEYSLNVLHGNNRMNPSISPERLSVAHKTRFADEIGLMYPRLSIIQSILKQLIDVLRWMHNRGICHLDLSLENVLLVSNDAYHPRIKIIDFGVSADYSECVRDANGKWSDNRFVGKPDYKPYEVRLCDPKHWRYRSDNKYDPTAVDVWTIGVMLWLLIFKDYPFRQCDYGDKKQMWPFIIGRPDRLRRVVDDSRVTYLLSSHLFDIMAGIFKPESERISVDEIYESEFCFGADSLCKDHDLSVKDDTAMVYDTMGVCIDDIVSMDTVTVSDNAIDSMSTDDSSDSATVDATIVINGGSDNCKATVMSDGIDINPQLSHCESRIM